MDVKQIMGALILEKRKGCTIYRYIYTIILVSELSYFVCPPQEVFSFYTQDVLSLHTVYFVPVMHDVSPRIYMMFVPLHTIHV